MMIRWQRATGHILDGVNSPMNDFDTEARKYANSQSNDPTNCPSRPWTATEAYTSGHYLFVGVKISVSMF